MLRLAVFCAWLIPGCGWAAGTPVGGTQLIGGFAAGGRIRGGPGGGGRVRLPRTADTARLADCRSGERGSHRPPGGRACWRNGLCAAGGSRRDGDVEPLLSAATASVARDDAAAARAVAASRAAFVSADVRCAKAATLASVGLRAGAGPRSAAAPVGGDGAIENKSAELLPSMGLLDRAMGMGGSVGSACARICAS